MFNVHINEACSLVCAIKYINKGSDQAIFDFRNTELANPVDEFKTYGHYVSSNETVWPLLGFPLHEINPTITHFSVHLENGERVYFKEINLQERLYYVLLQKRKWPLFLISVQEMNSQEIWCMFRYQSITIGTQQEYRI